jgi:shikimate dehydrogenase
MGKEGYRGFNITIPYKKDMLAMADTKGGEVEKIGAANTAVFENGAISIFNTDYFGFKKTLEVNSVQIEGKNWLVLGSGGSAQSVKAVLRDGKASRIITASRSKSGGGFVAYGNIANLENIYGIVNTTPVGMYPDTGRSVVRGDIMEDFEVALDLIYNPAETLFLKNAKGKGLKTVNGLYMLVAQAVKSEEIWNGICFEDDLIERIYSNMRACHEE